MNSSNTLDDLRRNATLAAEALSLWQTNGTGPFSLATSTQFGWLRIPQAETFFKSFGVDDPSAGLTSAHFEHIPAVGDIPGHHCKSIAVLMQILIPQERFWFHFRCASI